MSSPPPAASSVAEKEGDRGAKKRAASITSDVHHQHGELVFICGPPHAGKSALAEQLLALGTHTDVSRVLSKHAEEQNSTRDGADSTKRRKTESGGSGSAQEEKPSLHFTARAVSVEVSRGRAVLVHDNEHVAFERTRETFVAAVQKRCGDAVRKKREQKQQKEDQRQQELVDDAGDDARDDDDDDDTFLNGYCEVIDLVCQPIGGLAQCWRAHFMARAQNALCRIVSGNAGGAAAGGDRSHSHLEDPDEAARRLLQWEREGAADVPGAKLNPFDRPSAAMRPRRVIETDLFAVAPRDLEGSASAFSRAVVVVDARVLMSTGEMQFPMLMSLLDRLRTLDNTGQKALVCILGREADFLPGVPILPENTAFGVLTPAFVVLILISQRQPS
jgi:energy-coupling factor transporter ATP-binding protein EcfA2